MNNKNTEHLIVTNKSIDSFGTLHVIILNTINNERFSVYLDEGDHDSLSNEISLISEDSEAMSKN